ncbi:hypothetical protein O6P43_020628 [Quillaja saponaria]|uniref:Uncharacterized protein n=1 Tax=Quillaja saponaria TaxID=32244 RepID=A0AAD7LL37_QUISA|nr:hypothetical protein O6P43_020628 [Quillaja saponaria]
MDDLQLESAFITRLLAGVQVSCRVWLKERNPSLDISEAKWPGEEEVEEEERLAKMLAETEVATGEESEDEGAADREVETIELDADGVVEGEKNEDNNADNQ